MQPIFYQSPAGYRAESERISHHLWITLPIAVTVGLYILSVVNPSTYRAYLQPEGALLETLQSLLAFATAGVALRLLALREMRADPLIAGWLILFVVGGVYLGGEEASWGQHYIGWNTPDSWAEVNWQGETNLHNASIWFDHVPRVILTLGIVVGGLIVPWMKLTDSRLLWRRVDFIYPPLALATLAALLVLAVLEDAIDAATGLFRSAVAHSSGEMQENFIIAFLFLYVLFLWRRAREVRSRGR